MQAQASPAGESAEEKLPRRTLDEDYYYILDPNERESVIERRPATKNVSSNTGSGSTSTSKLDSTKSDIQSDELLQTTDLATNLEASHAPSAPIPLSNMAQEQTIQYDYIEARIPCEEEDCFVTSTRPADADRHLLEVHGPAKICPEPGCFYEYRRGYRLQRHLETKHDIRNRKSGTIVERADHGEGSPPVPTNENPPCNTLYVGNLPIDASEEELKALFSKQRGYKRLLFRTKQNGPMCLVEYDDVSCATKALQELDGHLLQNSTPDGIRLSFSKNPLGVRSGQGMPSPGPSGEAYSMPTSNVILPSFEMAEAGARLQSEVNDIFSTATAESDRSHI